MNLGTPRILDPVSRDAILSALRAGETIKAIKYYRLATGTSLSEAKNAVDAMRAQNNIQAPQSRASTSLREWPFARPLLVGIAALLAIAIYYARVTH